MEYAPYTIASLAAGGGIFVVGEATAFEPAVFNTADGKKPRGFFARPGSVPSPQPQGQIYTPVVLQVGQVLAGDAKPGTLRALIEGGTLGCYTVTVDGAPKVELKKRYVFELTAGSLDADGKVVPEQHKVFIAWPVDANDVVQTMDGPMPLSSLARALDQVAPSPVP